MTGGGCGQILPYLSRRHSYWVKLGVNKCNSMLDRFVLLLSSDSNATYHVLYNGDTVHIDSNKLTDTLRHVKSALEQTQTCVRQGRIVSGVATT